MSPIVIITLPITCIAAVIAVWGAVSAYRSNQRARRAWEGVEGTVCDAYQPPATAEMTGLCSRCGMYDYKHHEAP